MFKSLLTTLFIAFIAFNLQAQKLNRTERKIIDRVKSLDEESLSFLEQVVNINSGTLNQKGVKEVGNVFRSAFQEIGFQTQWINMPAEMNRAGHLFASINGDKGKKLLLIGHLDTVFEENSPFQTFERINDSMAYGPGAN
ncbi:M20 family peptidase, partial [Flavobacteriaceae bacterium]|nr:M20 family peptidase [Flavobacteriaceae bacterium]